MSEIKLNMLPKGQNSFATRRFNIAQNGGSCPFNPTSQDQLSEIEGVIEDQRDPFFPLDGVTLYYNHTEEPMQDWWKWKTVWTTIFYIFTSIVANILYYWLHGVIYSEFTGVSFQIILLRSVLMFFLHYFIIRHWGFWIGAYFIPWLSFLMAFNYTFFQHNQVRSDGSSRAFWIFELLLKPIIFIITQLIGAFAGLALIGVTTDNIKVVTSDCTVDTVSACDALPKVNGINDNAAYAIQILGAVLIAAAYLVNSYAVAEPRDSTREQRVRARRQFVQETSFTVASVYALLHALWGARVGGCWNTLYWLVLAVYTNNFDGVGVYIWPSLIGFVIVLVCVIIANWFMGQARGGDADQKDLEKTA